MKLDNNRFFILASIAFLMVAVTIIVYMVTGYDSPDFKPGGKLIEGFEPDKFQSIEVSRGEDSVKLVRQEGDFFVSSLRAADGTMYPAKTEDVNRLITECADIELAARVTEDQALYGGLGVAIENEEGDKKPAEDISNHEIPTVVRFLDGKNKLLYGLIKGKSAEAGSGSYVRMIGQKTVYTSSKWISLDYLPNDYIETKLTDFPEKDVGRVVVTLKDEKYSIERDKDGNIQLQGIPEGKQAREWDVKSVFHALSSLNFEQVYSPADKILADLEWDSVYRCELKKDKYLAYEARIAAKGKKDKKDKDKKEDESISSGQLEYYIKITAEGPSTEQLEAAGDEAARAIREAKRQGKTLSNEESKKKVAAFDARDKAEKFNQLHSRWVYRISKWKADDFCKPFKELIEDASKEDKEKKSKTKASGPEDPTALPVPE